MLYLPGGNLCLCNRQHECLSLLQQQTFEEAEKGFDETLAKEKGMNRDDRVHGALLILNELVRISSMEGEVMAWIYCGNVTSKTFLSLSCLCDSACVRRWRRSRSSSWSMISTARSWWDLEQSPATSHPSLASSQCSHSSPMPSWAYWATARRRASLPLEPPRYLPKAHWWRVDTAVSWWRSDSIRYILQEDY